LRERNKETMKNCLQSQRTRRNDQRRNSKLRKRRIRIKARKEQRRTFQDEE